MAVCTCLSNWRKFDSVATEALSSGENISVQKLDPDHVQRVSAKHGVKDDFAFLWEHAIFRHPPNKNPLTDRSAILNS
jgi:hypothetical protein